MKKKSKYTLLGLGGLTLLTLLSSPIIYYTFKANKIFKRGDYKLAALEYKKLGFISSTYYDYAAIAYYRSFLEAYTDPKKSDIIPKILNNPLNKSEFRTEYNLNVNTPNTQAYKLMYIFDTINEYKETIPVHSKAFLFDKNKKFIEDLKSKVNQLEIEDTHYLHEAIDIVELFIHKQYIVFCIYNEQIKNAVTHLPHVTDTYNNIIASTISKYGKKKAQYIMTRLFNDLYIKENKDPLQDDFDTQLLSIMSSIKEDNNDLINLHGNFFSIQHLLPFISAQELDNKYNDFVNAYTHSKKASLITLSEELRGRILFSTSNNIRRYYGTIDNRFVYLNQFYKQSWYSSFENKENLQALNTIMTEFSDKKEYKALAEIAALYAIKTYHIEAFKATKTGGYPTAEKYFNISEKIYEQYVNNAHPVFKEYYINIWAIRERNIGRNNFPDLSTHERSQIKKHMGTVLKKLKSQQ